MHDLQEAERKRLLWRCRRGLLELDILLARLIQDRFAGLTAEQLNALDQMLDLTDNAFLDLILGRSHTNNPAWQSLLCALQPPTVTEMVKE